MCGNIKKSAFLVPRSVNCVCGSIVWLTVVGWCFAFVSSCGTQKPEPIPELRVSESKVYLDNQYLMPLDSLTGQKGYLIQSLENLLVASREGAGRYRDSLLADMSEPTIEKDHEVVSKPSASSIRQIDSLKDQPFKIRFKTQQRISVDTFIKIYYTASVSGYDVVEIQYANYRGEDIQYVDVVRDRCTRYSKVLNFFGSGQRDSVEIIDTKPLESLDFLKLVKEGSHIPDHRHQRPEGSLKTIVELVKQGINLKFEWVTETNDSIIWKDYWVLEANKDVTLPNIGESYNWTGLRQTIEKLARSLSEMPQTFYCENIIFVRCSGQTDFDDFRKAVSATSRIKIDIGQDSVYWYKGVVPQLNY